jgi:hypothetical protein
MPTKYGDQLVAAVLSSDVRSLGEELALLCIKANLSAVYVAQVLGVSRMTIHTWFRGGSIRPRKKAKIRSFMKILKEDLENGALPVTSVVEGRKYLQGMSKEPLRPANTRKSN